MLKLAGVDREVIEKWLYAIAALSEGHRYRCLVVGRALRLHSN
jgi:hypothetical protein